MLIVSVRRIEILCIHQDFRTHMSIYFVDSYFITQIIFEHPHIVIVKMVTMNIITLLP